MASGHAEAAPGDIYVVDRSAFGGSGGVISVDPATGTRTTVSSNTSADGPAFFDPAGIALEADGDILVADYGFFGDGAVLRVDPATGVRTTVSHNGSPLGAPNFLDPQGIAVEPDGDIQVADYGAFAGNEGGVIGVNPLTGARTIESSNSSPPGSPKFVDPIGVALEADGKAVVADIAGGSAGSVIRVGLTGNRSLVSSNATDPGPAFADPNGIAMETGGNILVADFTAFSGGGGVIAVDPASGTRSTVSENSAPGGTPIFIDPVGIGLEANGSILVADASAGGGPGGVIRVDPVTGARSTASFNATASGPSFADPMDLAVVPPAAGGDGGAGGGGGGAGGGDAGAGGGDSGGSAEAGAPGVAYIDNNSARLKRGKFPLEIGCEAGGADCDGELTLTAAKRTRRSVGASTAASRKVILASVPIAVPAGQTALAKAKMSRKGLRLFERRRRVKAEATILTTGAAGDRTATDTIKVKRKRKR